MSISIHRLRAVISASVKERAPWLHAHLKELLSNPRARPIAPLDATPIDVTGKRHALSNLHPALSDPDLSTLERPREIHLTPEALNRSPANVLHEPVVDLKQMRQSAASVCFVVPVRQADITGLERTLQCVLRQTDPSWEVLLCVTPQSAEFVSPWLDVDWRIRRFVAPGPVPEAKLLGLSALQATTTFAGLLSLGDLIDDDLVKLIGEKLRSAPQSDVIYTDEAARLDDDQIGKPFYKPDWSPEHQQSVNMIGRFVAIRKALLLELRAPSAVSEAAAEYELLLEATSAAQSVQHIDDALYIRSDASPTWVGGFFAADALDEARDVLEHHVRRESAAACVIALPTTGSLRVNWPLPSVPVTLLILTGMFEKELPDRGPVTLATHFVRSIISKSTYVGYRILVVDDGYVPDDLRALLETHGHRCISYPKKATFSFADKANFASAQVREGIAILLNDDLEVIAPDWIEALVSQAARPDVGVVGGKLQFPDGTIQHAGITLGFHGSAGHIFHRHSPSAQEYGGFANVERNYSAVTGAVMAYRKDVFDAVGGVDVQFSTDYNDLDFCLKCIGAGYRVVFTPAANLYHFHNASLKRTKDNDAEREAFLEKWNWIVARDPFFSKHFQTASHDRPLLER